MPDSPALFDAIHHLEGCEATWVESVPVVETSGKETVWARFRSSTSLDTQRPSGHILGAMPPPEGGDSSTSCFIFPRWTAVMAVKKYRRLQKN
jgi:hypothetical protein